MLKSSKFQAPPFKLAMRIVALVTSSFQKSLIFSFLCSSVCASSEYECSARCDQTHSQKVFKYSILSISLSDAVHDNSRAKVQASLHIDPCLFNDMNRLQPSNLQFIIVQAIFWAGSSTKICETWMRYYLFSFGPC